MRNVTEASVHRQQQQHAHRDLDGNTSSSANDFSLVADAVDLLAHELKCDGGVGLPCIRLDGEHLPLPYVQYVGVLKREGMAVTKRCQQRDLLQTTHEEKKNNTLREP